MDNHTETKADFGDLGAFVEESLAEIQAAASATQHPRLDLNAPEVQYWLAEMDKFATQLAVNHSTGKTTGVAIADYDALVKVVLEDLLAATRQKPEGHKRNPLLLKYGVPSGTPPGALRKLTEIARGAADAAVIRATRHSEQELAERMERFRGDLLYVPSRGWFAWSGNRWTADSDNLRVKEHAAQICREAADEALAVSPKARAQSPTTLNSQRTARAVVSLAETKLRIEPSRELDQNPMLLNTPAGVINLDDGSLRPQRRSRMAADYITLSTTVSPGARGDCPEWLKFLGRVLPDPELIAFIQRFAGYCLTGSTKEDVFLFLYGSGRNGKSTFVDQLVGVLGDYAAAIQSEQLMNSKNEQHREAWARLAGKRLVVCSEIASGRTWNEAMLKQVTGGDSITARHMYQGSFEYKPQFKLIIHGNEQPALNSVDPAIRARLKLVPFTVQIPESEIDPMLRVEKLPRERPGIFRWMLDGLADYQCNGLNPPTGVSAASAEYLDSADMTANWIAERCDAGPAFRAKSSDLYADYRAWTERQNEKAKSQTAFSLDLKRRGFERNRSTGKGSFFLRIRIKEPELTEF